MADAVIKNDIRHFLGMVTNADSEDLKPEYCREIDGFEALSTLLRKTLGGGNYFSGEALSTSAPVSMIDFVSDKINIVSGGYTIIGNIELLLLISKTTGLSVLYAWDNDSNFRLITTLSQFIAAETLYLRYASGYNNPMIQTGDVLRIISGKQAYNGANLIQNGWIGWIDRGMFNDMYAIPPNFYIYKAPIPNNLANLAITIESQAFDSTKSHENPIDYYYKYSLIYDYAQEGLLSDLTLKQQLYDDEVALLNFVLSEASEYKRLTGINIYRSETRNHGYELISNIGVTKKAESIISGDDAGCLRKAFFNNSDIYNHNFIPGVNNYLLHIVVDDDGTPRDLINELLRMVTAGTGNKIIEFVLNSQVPPSYNAEYHGLPIISWELIYDPIGEATLIASGDADDLMWDLDVISFNTSDYDEIKNGYFITLSGKGTYEIIDIMNDESGNVSLRLSNNIISIYAQCFSENDFIIMLNGSTSAVTGYNSVTNVATMIAIDYRLASISTHPLDGEVSIQVNANYACYLNGRMFLLDCILDPEDTAEEHNDLLMYSEYLQPDVVPVSNAISCDNPLGGESMGLAPFFDSLLILMKHTIYQLRTLDITNPNSWVLTESPHKIGCVSRKSFVVAAGSLYVVYYDGIYEFTPNMLAESDRTPVESMRISEPINNLFMRLSDSQKENLVLRHDKIRNEIMVDVIDISETEVTNFKTLCYDLTYKTWRVDKYNSDPVNDAVEFYNQESHLIQWDDGAGLFIDINSPGARAVSWKSKTYVHEYEKYEIIKTMAVTYYSGDAVTVAIYDAEKGTSLFSKTLEAKTAPGTEKFGVRVRAKKYYIKVSATSSSNEVEIYRIVVESERSLS